MVGMVVSSCGGGAVLPPLCFFCKHYREMEQELWKNKCMAYPAGIPEELWDGDAKHLEPRDGDKGFVFEADEEFRGNELMNFIKGL